MNLRESDVGKRFVAPSGRLVTFESKRNDTYFFMYEDDPTDGVALSQDALRILDEPDDDVDAAPRAAPRLAS
jgi:hypothetical protein